MERIKIPCATCGSEEVRRNCDAAWSVEEQRWEITALFDSYTCEDCGGECGIVETKMLDR